MRLARALRAAAAEGSGRSSELALIALSRAGDGEFPKLLKLAAESAEPASRRAAAESAALVLAVETIEHLSRDPDASVRLIALQALLDSSGSGPEVVARRALLDSDPAIRTATLEWLIENPVAPIDELLLAARFLGSERPAALKVQAARALAARGEREPLERGAVVAALERFAEDSNYLVRRAGNQGLIALGRTAGSLGTATDRKSLKAYREMAHRAESRRFAEILSARGRLVLEIDCPAAPMTCLSFLQLAAAGFYDGTAFHRVIPDFVAQGGDPRGDGWGGPGFSLRDEHSPIPFERGVVGMARSDTHTAGSQFFLTASSQPHLTGRYTAFGRVVEGVEVIDQIEQGDRIVRVRELASAAGVPATLR